MLLCHSLPRLRSLAAKVSFAHGAREPALFSVSILVAKLADIVLPRLGRDDDAVADWLPEVAIRLAELRAVADDYTLPAWASPAYRTLMNELAALEADLLDPVGAMSRAS